MKKESFISRRDIFLNAKPFRQLLLLLIVTVVSVPAQELTSRPERGLSGKGTRQTSDIDSINLQNGSVTLALPLASLPPVAGGKLSYTLSAYYNSNLWNGYRTEVLGKQSGCDVTYTKATLGIAGDGGWSIGGQYEIIFRDASQDYDYLLPNSSVCGNDFYAMQGRFFKPILKMPDGSEHEMRIENADFPIFDGYREHLQNYYKAQGSGYLPFTSQIRLYTVDGTYITATFDPSGDYAIYLKDGTQVQSATGGGQRIKDMNGNSILITAGSAEDEQTGREIKWSQTTYGLDPATKVEYQSVGGTWQTVWIIWGKTTVEGIIYETKDWDQNAFDPRNTCDKAQIFTGRINVIRQIILPAAEQTLPPQKYVFDYNSDTKVSVTTNNVKFTCGSDSPPATSYTRDVSGMGEISRVITPTGAEIKYTYQDQQLSPIMPATDFLLKNAIQKKEVIHDGTTDTWNYNVPLGTIVDHSSMTAPDGSLYEEDYYPTDPLRNSQAGTTGLGGLTYRNKQSGKIMSEKHWTLLGGTNLIPFGSGPIGNRVTFNPAVDTEYTTLLADDGITRLKMTAKKFQYDYNGELIQTIEYDWFDPGTVIFGSNDYPNFGLPTGVPASATVLRVVNNGYYNQSAAASSTNAYQKRSLGTSTTLLGFLMETTVGDGTNVKSKSQISYDGLNYGTAPTKGNATQASAWNDTNNQWINSGMIYDSYGNVITKTDPKGYTAQIFYEDNTHAMPTKTIVDPLNGSGQQISTATYDYYTGAILSSTDINGNISSVDYYNHLLGAVDPYARPGTTCSPYISIDGINKRRTVKTYYEDAARKTRVESDLFNEGDQVLKTRETRDQLGRAVMAERNENGANNYTISSETVYKTQDRIVLQSNPHRSSVSSTDGWTRATGDILGRSIEAATFSGTAQPPIIGTNANWTGSVTTAYLTNTTTVTDQAGRQRRSITNALGQLTRVDEPDVNNSDQLGAVDSPYQPTNYSYDILGNLTQVVQGVQTRTFQYDSLSRLKQAANPESGAISYIYDNNGNLTSKTDARGVVTAYSYDALNRVTNRNYSAPPGLANYQAAPNVVYTYDDPNIANAKGRLTKVSATGGTNITAETRYQAFDILGRVVQSQQWIDGTSYGDPMTYSYNLSGALVEQKYPSGRVVKNVLDANGDLAIVQSKKNAASGYFNYAKNFSYTAAGAVTSMQLGNGRWESTQFNSRLQPTQIALGTTQNATDKLKLNFTYNTAGQNDNNGNVLSQTITVPTETRNNQTYNSLTAVQAYTYDALNRLKSATENINGGSTPEWKQTFTYDRYGNRNFDTANNNTTTIPAGCAVAVCNPQVDPATNKLIGYNFDNAGNTKTDASGRSFIYDGMNRETEVKDTNGVSIGKYFYDGEKRRVKKISAQETTIFVYNAFGQLVAEYSTATNNTPQVSYLTTDALGTPRLNTDANGNVTARHDYFPFGEEIPRSSYGQDTIRQKFTGYEENAETPDIDFAQARYYSKILGRFLTVDPSGSSAKKFNPQTLNRYNYVLNNPLNLVDPSGLQQECPKGEKCIDRGVVGVVNIKIPWYRKLIDTGKSVAKKLFGSTTTHAQEIEEDIEPREPLNEKEREELLKEEGFEPIEPPFIGPRLTGAQKEQLFRLNNVGIPEDLVPCFIDDPEPVYEMSNPNPPQQMGPPSLPQSQINTVEDLLNTATGFTRLKHGEKMASVNGQGDAYQILNNLAKTYNAPVQALRNGSPFFTSGNIRVGIHNSRSGTTLDVNQAGAIYKLRVTP